MINEIKFLQFILQFRSNYVIKIMSFILNDFYYSKDSNDDDNDNKYIQI